MKPIKKRRLFEEVILELEKYIRNHHIRPGHRLPSENEIASMFGVSKTAVREAITVLEAHGVVRKKAGAGIFLENDSVPTIVQSIVQHLLNVEELKEILDFRRGIEVEAAALAAVRATQEDLERIRSAHTDLIAAIRAMRIGVKEDFMFHYSIILASHNRIYKQVYDAVAEKFELGIRFSKMQSMRVPGRFWEGIREHEAIFQAIQRQDAQLASQAMRHHLAKNEEKIWAHLPAHP